MTTTPTEQETRSERLWAPPHRWRAVIQNMKLRQSFSENPTPHSWQAISLSPVCVCICIFILYINENLIPHSWQVNGLYPVCVRRCLFRWLPCANHATHSLQLNCFSQVWVCICLIRSPSSANPTPQLKGLLSGMYSHMSFQGLAVWKACLTLLAG